MSDYDEMSLDELKELKAKREADKLRMELQNEDATKAQAEQEAYEKSIKEKAINEYLSQNPPKSKITTEAPSKKDDVDVSKFSDALNAIVQSTGQPKLFEYGCACADGDTSDCAGHDFEALRKDDVFIKGVWHALYCRANLLKYAVPGVNINAGDGLSVQIRTVGKFSVDPVERSACSCLDCGNVAFDSYNVCVQQFGMKTEICALDIFDVGETLRTEVIKAMGFRWGEWLDQELFNMLIGESSDIQCGDQSSCTTYDEDLTVDISNADEQSVSSVCCEIPAAEALYNAVIDIEANMREANMSPKVLIISPTVAALFKYQKGTDLPLYIRNNIVVKDNILTKIGNIEVLESCVAPSMSEIASGSVIGVIIDPSRAFGFAMGKRPSLESDRNIDCNSTTYAMWAYMGASILDCTHIARIKNLTTG